MSIIIPKEHFPDKLHLKKVLKIPDGNIVAISPDGTQFLSIKENKGYIWDLESGLITQSFHLPADKLQECSFSNNNNYIAFVDCFWMSLWDINNKKMLWKLDTMEYRYENNYCIKITPDNKYVVSAGDTITVRDLITAEIVWNRDNPMGTTSSLKISGDGKYIITDYLLWDLNTGKLIREFNIDEDDDYFEINHSHVAISPNNKFVAGTFGLGATIVWNSMGNIVYKLRKHIDLEQAEYADMDLHVDFSFDGKYIASISYDRRSIDIWETSTGKSINKLYHNNKIHTMKFLPYAYSILSGTFNGYVFIWDFISDLKNQIRDDFKFQKELLSEIRGFRRDQIFIHTKKFIDDHIKWFFEKPSKKRINKLMLTIPEHVEEWPEDHIQFFIKEYNRTIDRYKKLSPPKWKKWSKYLLNLISVLK